MEDTNDLGDFVNLLDLRQMGWEQFQDIRHFPLPRGPTDQTNSRFRSRLSISIENEIFERATHRGPILVLKSRHRD